MSAVAHWLVYCDGGPECPIEGYEAHEGDASVSLRGLQNKRSVLKREGWSCVRGKDYCPECTNRRRTGKGEPPGRRNPGVGAV